MANEVATAWVSVVPTTKGFGSTLSGQIGGDVDASGRKAGSRFGGAFGAAAALAGAAGVGSFLKGAIDGASDLEEATSKTQVVFGKAADEILRFSDGGAKAFGQTKNEVLAAASTFGTFGKAAGLSGKDLSKFSTDFVSLSADLASFHNASPEEAVDALGAALRGEAEPMRRFGVLLDDASMRAKALELGLISSTKNALTPQQKTLAAQALIMEQTKDAQGDFARTSDGLANSQRILSASFGDLQTKVGSFFLPVVTAATQGAIALVSGLANSGPVLSQVGTFFANAFAPVLPLLTQVGNAIRAQVVPVVQQAATVFQTTILPALMSLGSYIVANVLPILTRLGQIFVSQVIPIVGNFASFIVGTLVPAIVQIYQKVASNLKPIFEQLVATFRGSVLPALSQLLSKFQEWQPTIQKVIEVVVKIIGKVAEFASTILGKVLPPVIQFAGYLLGNVVGAITAVIGVAVKIIAKMIEVGAAFVDGVKDVAKFASEVGAKIGEAIGFVSGLKDKVVAAVSGAGQWLYNAGKSIIQGLIDGVEGMIGSLRSKFESITNMIPDWKGPADRDASLLTPAGRLIMMSLLRGIDEKKKDVKKSLTQLTDEIETSLDGLLKKTSSWTSKIDKALGLDKIGKGTKKSLGEVKGELTGLERSLGKAIDKIGDLRSKFDELKGSVANAFKVDLFSSENLAGFMEAGNGAVAQLDGMLKAFETLKANGASEEFLAGLFKSGNAALAAELAASPDALGEAQRIWQTQESLADQLGNAVASEVYGDDIEKVRTELVALRTDVREAAKEAAQEFASAINEAARKSKSSKSKGKGKGK